MGTGLQWMSAQVPKGPRERMPGVLGATGKLARVQQLEPAPREKGAWPGADERGTPHRDRMCANAWQLENAGSTVFGRV